MADFDQGSAARRRPRRPSSLKPSFYSLKRRGRPSFSSWTETRNLKIQYGEDVDVLRRPDFDEISVLE